MTQNPLDTKQAEELDKRTSAPKVIVGPEDYDLATSLRPGESGAEIARNIEGLTFAKEEAVGIGRLGLFNIEES